jgi:peptide/nickel transport system substrate-binding protein
VRRRSSAMILATALALPAAACTDAVEPRDDERARTAGTGFASTGIDPRRQPPAPPVPGAVDGGVITVHNWFGIEENFDPALVYFADSVSILSGLVTRSLTQLVYDPASGSMVLVPDIATDIGTPNDDFTEWTYTIRPGVKFEDGTAVTAETVAYGIMRTFDRTSFEGGPDYSNRYFVDGDTYRGPHRSGTDYAGIVVDGSTLTLKMARPFPELPYWASFPAMGPVPPGSSPRTYGAHPLATGPYKIEEYVPGRLLTLSRNDLWDPDTDPGRHQYADAFRFVFDVPDIAATDRSIMADAPKGRTTAVYQPHADDVAAALSQTPELVTQGPTACVYWLAPDYRKIKEIEVRQAIGYAYPYEALVSAGGGVDGITFTPGHTLLPPGTPGRIEYNPLDIDPGETDPAKARALLAEAGYPPGEYTLTYPVWTGYAPERRQNRVLAEGLEAGGFRVDEDPIRSSDILRARMADPDAPYNLRRRNVCADWPTGGSSLLALLSTANSSEEGLSTYTFFDEPSVDAEIARIEQLPVAEQPAAWGALDQEVGEKYYPLVVEGYAPAAMLHGSRIGGMNNDSSTGMPTWEDMYVKP